MPTVEYEVRSRTAYVTLNRPEKLNAINVEMREELWRIFNDVNSNPDVWVLVITGAGRAFSVGHDLIDMADDRGVFGRTSTDDLYVLLSNMWKPTIAAINGFCLAQGGGIALACDIRIASEEAQFGWPQVKRGIASISGPSMLTHRIPLNLAFEYLFTGEFLDANEAHRLHLVNKVVPSEELMPTVQSYVEKIQENAPLAMRAIKQAAVRGLSLRLEDRVAIASGLRTRVLQTEDAKEGLKAFQEKRTPVFKGS